MKKILLDGKEVEQLHPESLPMLIHGREGSGASLYTICLAAKWHSQGYEILFLCGHPMAEQEFAREVASDYVNAKFYTQEKTDDFLAALEQDVHHKTIVVVKNIELFDTNILDVVTPIHNLIVSGDVNQSKIKDILIRKKFITEVYFSPLEGKEIPELEKFHGFVASEDYTGVTQLSE